MLGVYMQRSWLILWVTCIFLLPIYLFSAPILKLLGQDDEIAKLAGKFTILTIPQLFSLAISFPTQKFLQAQSKVSAFALIGFVALILHIVLLYVFIYAFGWGMAGAAIAYDISSWIISIAQVIYVIGWCKDGWHGLTWAAFTDIWAFVRLSLASAVMLCLEIWYMTSIIILTGHLDDAIIAVGSLSIWSVHDNLLVSHHKLTLNTVLSAYLFLLLTSGFHSICRFSIECISMNLNGWVIMLFVGINAAIR